ncbi:MAG: hypothetical protein LUC30_07635 [Clostridiales bacterium]|nr:hypothetical protein [Clostridiales bacterium]
MVDLVPWQMLFFTFAQDTPPTVLLFTVGGVFCLHISQIEVAISLAQMAGFDFLLLYFALAPVTAKLE